MKTVIIFHPNSSDIKYAIPEPLHSSITDGILTVITSGTPKQTIQTNLPFVVTSIETAIEDTFVGAPLE